MINELIFIFHAAFMSCSALAALWFGQAALVAFITLQCVLANLFVIKQITLFGLTATTADAFTIGSVLGLNLLQEYYGRPSVRKAIWVSFTLMVFYAIASQIQLIYLPNAFDTTQAHFVPILSLMPRIVGASFTVYLLVAHIDAWLFAHLQRWFSGTRLAIRTFVSMAVCQLIDTILFSFLGLYGIVDNIWQIILISYTIKIATAVVAMPFVGIAKKLVPTSD